MCNRYVYTMLQMENLKLLNYTIYVFMLEILVDIGYWFLKIWVSLWPSWVLGASQSVIGIYCKDLLASDKIFACWALIHRKLKSMGSCLHISPPTNWFNFVWQRNLDQHVVIIVDEPVLAPVREVMIFFTKPVHDLSQKTICNNALNENLCRVWANKVPGNWLSKSWQ